MTKIKINKKKRTLKNPIFKNNMTGLDFINSHPDAEKKKLIIETRLIPQGIIEPQTSYEEIINLPMYDFMALLLNFRINQSRNMVQQEDRNSLIEKFRLKGNKKQAKKEFKKEFRFPDLEQQLPPDMPPMSVITLPPKEDNEIKEEIE